VGERKKEARNQGVSPQVVENTCRKMSAFGLSTMLMKTNELFDPFHDVDEKKGC
jgi:hypothetical protein